MILAGTLVGTTLHLLANVMAPKLKMKLLGIMNSCLLGSLLDMKLTKPKEAPPGIMKCK